MIKYSPWFGSSAPTNPQSCSPTNTLYLALKKYLVDMHIPAPSMVSGP